MYGKGNMKLKREIEDWKTEMACMKSIDENERKQVCMRVENR